MKNSLNSNSSRSHGFTLVEILVTVTIILVLAALTTMGTQKLRASADTTTTLRRITGLAQANALYATDHGGSYVPSYAFDEESKFSGAWHYNPAFLEALIGETPSTVKPEEYEGYDGLPEQVLDPTVVRAKKKHWSRISASFGYNEDGVPGGGWGEPGTSRAHTITSVKNPSEAFAFITATDWIAKYSSRYLWKGERAVEGKTEDSKIAYRHQGKAVAAFYDGHAETLSIKDMQKIDRNGGINNVFWGGTRRGGK
jgi:prepilin-type N-terminal cleavage/methylation domain-containing protein/prepilin-type processing-associated H-X9-DG protein